MEFVLRPLFNSDHDDLNIRSVVTRTLKDIAGEC